MSTAYYDQATDSLITVQAEKETESFTALPYSHAPNPFIKKITLIIDFIILFLFVVCGYSYYRYILLTS